MTLAVLLLFPFPSCKKAVETSSFSLRTKKARLSGSWHAKTATAKFKYGGNTETYVIRDYKFRLDVTNSIYYYTGNYALNLDINKDGTFSFRETLNFDHLNASGTWNFNTGSGNAKSKEKFICHLTGVMEGRTFGEFFFNQNSSSFDYYITSLKNKELTIDSEGTVLSDQHNSKVDYSIHYTLIQGD
jgi:hypothetical protein